MARRYCSAPERVAAAVNKWVELERQHEGLESDSSESIDRYHEQKKSESNRTRTSISHRYRNVWFWSAHESCGVTGHVLPLALPLWQCTAVPVGTWQCLHHWTFRDPPTLLRWRAPAPLGSSSSSTSSSRTGTSINIDHAHMNSNVYWHVYKSTAAAARAVQIPPVPVPAVLRMHAHSCLCVRQCARWHSASQ